MNTIEVKPGKYTVQEIKAYTRLIKLQQGKENYERTLDSFEKLVLSPIWSTVLAYILIEGLQKSNFMPNTAGTILEGAVIAGNMTDAMAKSGVLLEMFKAGKDTAGSAGGVVKSVLPLLLAAGAAA